MAISDYSASASLNTTLAGINVGEGMERGNVSDALRQLMADIAGDLTGSITVSPKKFGAVADGVTDDTAALQAALNTGKIVALKEGATYLISSGLDHVTGSGFICFNGIATIKAKTGSGAFNIKTTAAPRTGLDRNMLRCNGTDNLILFNVHFTTDNVTAAVINGVRIIGGMGTVGYNIQNIAFSKFFAGSLVALGSVGSGRMRNLHIVSATDCGTSQGSTYWTGGIQTTVVEIDNDIIASTASFPGKVRIDFIRDILLSGQALIDFGQETDGVNMVNQGANSGTDWDIEIGVAERIGELVDIQGRRNNVRIGTAKNIYNSVAKLIHGARDNNIKIGTIYRCGKSAVELAGSSSGVTTEDTKDNVIEIGTVTEPGAYGLGLTLPAGDVSVVLISNGGSTFKPKKNSVRIGHVLGDGVNLDQIVKNGDTDVGLDNFVEVGKASGWAVASVSAPKGNVRVNYLSRCFADMTMSASPSISSATATILPFNTVGDDTEGVAVTASNRFTLLWPGIYRVSAQVRMDSWAVGVNDSWTLEIRQNTTTIRQARGKIFFSAKDETARIEADIYIDEDDLGTTNANLTAWITQDTGATKTVSNAASQTRFTIERVA